MKWKVTFWKLSDRVRHENFLSVLKVLGIEDYLRKWVKIFYRGIYSSVIGNGHLPKNSNHKLGKTGCPISALFEYCSEPQICAIKWNTYFKGINISFSDRTDFLTCRWYNNISLWLKVFVVVEIFNIFELYRRATISRCSDFDSNIIIFNSKILRKRLYFSSFNFSMGLTWRHILAPSF